MSENKLSSEEVPTKFSEWLLSMGCPPEKVPPVDKVVEMCRGQYYMVWRSLMEHVEPKDMIRQKRLHVFCDDIYKYKRKNAFNKSDTSTVMPAELMLWHRHIDVKEKVASAEDRVTQARQNLDQLIEKISTKLTHRNQSRQAVQDVQRRAWLLQQVAEDLRTKKDNLHETRAIADSLCSTNDEVDVQGKLERYLAQTRRGSVQPASSTSLLVANPVASSSVVSNGDLNDNEEQVLSLVSCAGWALWPSLLARRAALAHDLASDESRNHTAGVHPQSVVAHTAALQCSLALEALKNRAHIKQTRQRLAAAVNDLNSYLTGEACELLVVRCEEARAGARSASLRAALGDVTNQAGAFEAGGDAPKGRTAARQIAALDKAIESKKEELKRLVTSLAATETKIYNVRECLIGIFNGFHKDESLVDNERYRGHQAEFPAESMCRLRQYYWDRRERRRARDLSLDLDGSDHVTFTEQDNPKFADEIRIYLKKFNLEKNRKLVLESGEKSWSFESLSAATTRLHASRLLPPGGTLGRGLRHLAQLVQGAAELEAVLEAAGSAQNTSPDITLKSKQEEEEAIADRIKKRLNDNLLSLQKTSKTLDLGQENIRFWSDNDMRRHVSCQRQVAGKSYKDYEEIYLMNLS